MSGVSTIHAGASLALAAAGGSTYLGSMTWAELQASEYANGSLGLLALEADAQVFITDWRVAMIPSADKTYWETGGFFLFAQDGLTSLNSITGCNAALTWTLAADPANGKTRITASGAHGITSAVNGKCLSITAWSGSGAATGLYTVTYVDATNVDLTVAYGAGYGNPTVSPVGTETVITRLSPPAELLQKNSCMRITSQWRLTSSSNSHYCIVRMGATGYLYITPSSVTGYHDMRLISNVNSRSSQIGQKSDSAIFGGGNLSTSAIDTSATFNIDFSGRTNTVAEYVELMHYSFEICI